MKKFGNNILSNRYFCIDIETTALDPTSSTAGILEVYYKVISGDKTEREFFNQYFHENWKDTEHIHQIPFEELANRSKFTDSIGDINVIKSMFKECSDPNSNLVFMAQYSPFEWNWFKRFLNLSNEDLVWFKKVKTYDTRDVEKILYPELSHSLIPMCERYGIKPPNGQHDFHRADQDVNAMIEVMKHQKVTITNDMLTDYDPDNYNFDFNFVIRKE